MMDTPGNGFNGDYPRFKKQAFIRNDFPPKSDIQKVLEMCRENQIPGKLEIHLAGNGGVTAITYWERHPVEVENSS